MSKRRRETFQRAAGDLDPHADPKRGRGFRIERCWIFAAVDEGGAEGVIGTVDPDGVLRPWVATDERRRDQLIERARDLLADQRHVRTIRLIELSNRKDLQVFEPKGKQS